MSRCRTCAIWLFVLPALSLSVHAQDVPLKASLKFPSRHPYLLVTPADVERAKQRAERHPWAKKILDRLIRDARNKAAQPLGKLPPKGDQRHWSVAAELVQVGLGYAFTGDQRLAQWVRDGLLAYADLYPTLEWTNRRCRVFTQSSLYEAMWVESIAQAYDLVADSGAMSDRQRQHVEDDLLRAAVACFQVTDYEHDPRIRDLHYRCYNFQAWHLGAIGLVGLAVRDAEPADYAVNSRYGLKHLLAHDVRDDGLFWERSIGYHHFVIQALLPWTEAMLHCGVDLYRLEVPADRSKNEDCHYVTDTSSEPKSLRMMFDAPFYLAFPDLSYIALGDSDRGPLRTSWMRLIAWNRYRQPHVGWLLRRETALVRQPATYEGSAGEDWRWLVYDLPEPQQSADGPAEDRSVWSDQRVGNTGTFRDGCTLLPASGVAVLREKAGDFTADRDATAVALSYGPYGGGHGHPDKLSIALYALGRQWIPHFGSMPYESPWKAQWTSHTVSHNTVVVDGVSQRPAGQNDHMWPVDSQQDRAIGRLERFDPEGRLVSASCDTAYPGLVLNRQVRLRRQCVVDDFQVRPDPKAAEAGRKERRFDYVLHLDAAYVESRPTLAARSVTLSPGRVQVWSKLRLARGPGSVTLFTGTMYLASRLRLARGPGSVTLLRDWIAWRIALRLARGPGSVTLKDGSGNALYMLRLARGPGSVTLRAAKGKCRFLLRLARGPGSVTLAKEMRDGNTVLRLARGPGSVTLGTVTTTSLIVLRLARGPGSVTLKPGIGPRATELRLARGPGSVTLGVLINARVDLLRLARGPGSVTLHRRPLHARLCCGLLAGRDRLH